jgi:hypothetical protein
LISCDTNGDRKQPPQPILASSCAESSRVYSSLSLALFKRPSDLPSDRIHITPDVGLPKSQDLPSNRLQGASVSLIALDVGPYLGHPVWGIVPLGQSSDALVKVASMPKIPIDKDGDLQPRKNNVRAARETRRINAIAPATQP